MRRSSIGLVAVFVAAAAAAIAACSQRPALSDRATVSANLRELRSIDDLRMAFNRDTGKERVILLLSPT